MRLKGCRGRQRAQAGAHHDRRPAPSRRPRTWWTGDFTATAPNQLWVADFTYVGTRRDWVYVAFIFDVFSRMIVGWRAATTMTHRSGRWTRSTWRCGTGADAGSATCPGLVHHRDARQSKADSTGRRNTLIMEVFAVATSDWSSEDQRCAGGGAAAVACGSGVAAADALTGAA
ncbi:MAG: DDE-type integrase/transposase/recombinase [Candidatus Nanopelagicales bacterium]